MSGGMRVRLMALLNRAREGFWLVPSAMALGAVALGILLPWLDGRIEEPQGAWRRLPLMYDARPEGARALLAAVAGSSITVAATVFSITIATLALASQQFGPRLLRTFIADRGVQFALGTFVATFLYPLLVLRVVRGGDDELRFVPPLSLTLAILLAVLAVGVLIFFIDRVALMIRAPSIIDAVGEDLDKAIDDRIPADGRHGDSDEDADEIRDAEIPPPQAPAAIVSRRAGYVAYIDEKALIRLAAARNTAYRLASYAGSYVYEGAPLLLAHAAHGPPEEDHEPLRDAFNIAPIRTLQQDVVHGFNQLVELALRAISPGINDPFTATTCVDRICASLARLAGRPFTDPRLRDDGGRVRALTRRPTFAYLVNISFAPIRRYARNDAALLGRMLQGLAGIARQVPPARAGRLAALRAEAEAIARCFASLDPADRRMLEGEMASFEAAVRTEGTVQ